MAARRDSSNLGMQLPATHFPVPSMKVILPAAAVVILGAGLIFAWPGDSDDKGGTQSAVAQTRPPENTASADESLCDKQAWPYVDQRCAQRIDAARGTRQVRIVTDKGHSVNTVTPQPIVEQKPEPKPQPKPQPVAAQAERPIGPPAAPMKEQSETAAAAPQQQPAPAPQKSEKVATAPQPPAPAPQKSEPPQAAPAPKVQNAMAGDNPPVPTDAMTRNNPAPARSDQHAPVATSTVPPAPGTDAFAADSGSQKSKAERRAAEKARKDAEKVRRDQEKAKREAKRRKQSEEETVETGSVPQDVVATVKSESGSARQKTRRGRNAVPDEVVQAVEEAAAGLRRREGRRAVTLDSDRGGSRRVIVVPAEGGGF